MIGYERTEKSVPLLKKYWELLQTVSAPGELKLYQAVNYSLNHKTELEGYLADGRIEMTNNRAKRAIKPFVIVRKKLPVFGHLQRSRCERVMLQHDRICEAYARLL